MGELPIQGLNSINVVLHHLLNNGIATYKLNCVKRPGTLSISSETAAMTNADQQSLSRA